MSMTGSLLRVSQKELDEILSDSSLLEDRICAEDSDNDPELLDVDKAWEGVLYLLTGKSLPEIKEAQPPLVWVLFGEQTVDEEQDMGYGPAQYTTVEQVQLINEALSGITPEWLRRQFNPEVMTEKEIYPGYWQNSDFDYLNNHFIILKNFYRQAASYNQAVITFLS